MPPLELDNPLQARTQAAATDCSLPRPMKSNITKAELGLKRRRLQEGHDAKGAAIVRPKTGQDFHPENPRAPGMGLQHDALAGENDALGRRHHDHKQ